MITCHRDTTLGNPPITRFKVSLLSLPCSAPRFLIPYPKPIVSWSPLLSRHNPFLPIIAQQLERKLEFVSKSITPTGNYQYAVNEGPYAYQEGILQSRPSSS